MKQGFDYTQVLAMERAAARAWPALRHDAVEGWSVRLSGGGSRRANSVLPLAFLGLDPDQAIDRVEALYREQKTRCYFQISAISRPCDLDQRLEARGYLYEEPCLLMAKTLSPSKQPDKVEVTAEPSAAWMNVYTELLEPVRKDAAPGVLSFVPSPRAFFLYRHQGRPTTSALAVLSPDGIAVIECIATITGARRTGGAQVIMDALEAWSSAQGANIAALQVVADNDAARSLYEKRGYTVAGGYHYRFKDVVSGK